MTTAELITVIVNRVGDVVSTLTDDQRTALQRSITAVVEREFSGSLLMLEALRHGAVILPLDQWTCVSADPTPTGDFMSFMRPRR